ncbi:MAG: hypothetical protein ABJG78_12695 [Cyclobacteriaceae bacterium]
MVRLDGSSRSIGKVLRSVGLVTLLFPFLSFSASSDTLTIRRGDNLWSIALEKFDDGYIAYDLWGYRVDRRMGSPDLIYPGEKFILLPIDSIRQGLPRGNSDTLFQIDSINYYLQIYRKQLEDLNYAARQLLGQVPEDPDALKFLDVSINEIAIALSVGFASGVLSGSFLMFISWFWAMLKKLKSRGKSSVINESQIDLSPPTSTGYSNQKYILTSSLSVFLVVTIATLFYFNGGIGTFSFTETTNTYYLPEPFEEAPQILGANDRGFLSSPILVILTSFIVGIISVALPLIIGSINRIQKDYNSNRIADLVDKSPYFKYYKVFLITCLILLAITLGVLYFNVPFWLAIALEIALSITTGILLFNFLKLAFLILQLTSAEKIFTYLRPESANNLSEIEFRSIADLFLYSIRKDDTPLSREIGLFLGAEFRNERIGMTELVYPDWYYDLWRDSLYELCTSDSEKLAFLSHRIAGSTWIIGELKSDIPISTVTYHHLWSNLNLVLKYDQDDYLMYHWRTAHQYYTYSFKTYSAIEEFPDSMKNDQGIFFEFHTVLGALILYLGRYSLLGRMHSYTTSIPESYELLPKNLNQVIDGYLSFQDPFDFQKLSFYGFPNTEGIPGERIAKKWIAKYYALLFIRQMTQVNRYVGSNAEYINKPEDQSERQNWLDNLPILEKQIGLIYNDYDLLEEVGLKFVNDGWFIANKRTKPPARIESLISEIKVDFERAKKTQETSAQKIEKFKEESRELIEAAFKSIERASNKDKIEHDFDFWTIIGSMSVLDKAAFAENQPIDYMNAYGIVAEYISTKLYEGFSETFYYKKNASLKIIVKDLDLTLHKLELDPENHIIVSFGLNIEYLQNFVKTLGENYLGGIELINLERYNHAFVGESLFILNKPDLPALVSTESKEEDVEKYRADIEIVPARNVLGSVINLNEHEKLKNELMEEGTVRIGKDLDESVLCVILMNLSIRWRKDIKITMIELIYPYDDDQPDDLDNLEPF